MIIAAMPTLTDPGPQPTRGAEICVIMNVASGKQKDIAVEDALRAGFERHPGRFTLRAIRAGGSLTDETDRAVAEGFGIIVAAGGDGTICAVASRLVGSGRTMGLLPMGTFNFFARGLGVPEDVDEAIDLVATGTPRTVSVGEVNGRVFLNNASLGLYPAILQQREGTYRRWGRSRLAAHWSVLVTFFKFHRPLSLRVTVDGVPRRARTPLAFVARSSYQLDQYELDGGDCVRRGRFALFLAPDSNRWELLLYVLRLARGRMEPGRDFDLVCGDEIEIETRRRRRLVARDGERERMASPFRFRVRKDALKVIAPATEGL